MSQLNNRLLSIAIVLFIATTLASNGTVRTVAQTVSEVIVKNTTSNPVPVKAVGTTSVKVTNPVTAPVWTRDVNEARQPVQHTCSLNLNPGTRFGECELYTVPAGKRLVIEYVSGDGYVPVDQHLVAVRVYTTVGFSTISHAVNPKWQGHAAPYSYYTVGELTRIYADAGFKITVQALRSDPDQWGIWSASLSGYLVNVP
jgi:hypothetical protein